ncbi:MAG TPA: radical SAM family heme chaperone HemW [Mobilitalea sp.]|nr:radical SAM family heme chaperone HemW [Mobilitalea sp.]
MQNYNTENEKQRDLGLYIHIPFCIKKCDYCDFLSAPATKEVQEDYFDALLTEIKSYAGRMEDYTVPTIFFGGGTPSCVDAEYIKRILLLIRKVFHVDDKRLEATIEVNPGTVTKEKLLTYLEAGINRLSFGLQSADDTELKLLGRIHNYAQFKENYLLAREHGFQNINIDLMSALPGQTLSSWEDTLNKIIALNPEHISAYSLIIEEGTKFYDRYRESTDGYLELPDEETDRLIYHRTKQILELHGYHRYEISNYAKIGYECAHNMSYWIGTEYLGIGLGASSLLNGARYSIMHDIKQYIQACREYINVKINNNLFHLENAQQNDAIADPIGLIRDLEILTKERRMEEFMYLGLRMCGGISADAFLQRFGRDINSVYGDVIKRLIKDNLLIINGDNIHLSEYGIDVSNSVLFVFLLN